MNHPLLKPLKPIGVMSGENPRFPSLPGGHEGLKSHLDKLGFPYEEVLGHYGSPERSLIIHGIPRAKLFELGKKFGQESVIHGDAGHHEFIYTNGPDEGLAHPGLPTYETWTKDQGTPDDYWTKLPSGDSFRLHFDFDKRNPTGLGRPRKPSWPGQYDWHDGSTEHHRAESVATGLKKHDPPKLAAHPHTAVQPKPHANDQAAGKGVATYAEFAHPFGTIDEKARNSGGSNLFHYDYHGKNAAVNDLVAKHGFQVYYAGGAHGKPDLANKNYNTKHLMVYSPEPGSGGDFGNRDYTDSWRKVHELAHALAYPQLNAIYGEGRRIGKLGVHRTQNEATRAVHWEWLAAHKQRELNAHLGIHVPDEVFNRELNTVMHDAAHRAVTGKFTEPSEEGFVPHSHAVPLETSLNMVRHHARRLGLMGAHDLLPKLGKSERNLLPRGKSVANEKELSGPEFLQGLYKGLKQKVAEIEALNKAETALNAQETLLKNEKQYDCGHCGEVVAGRDRKAHLFDSHEPRTPAKFRLSKAEPVKKNADCEPMAMSVEKKLGDGGIADPSTEKGHMNKKECKLCGESLCKCGDVEKYAKGEYGPAGSSPTSPGPKPGKTPDEKSTSKVIEAPGSGGEIKKTAMPGAPAPAAPKMPSAAAPKAPKPPAMGAGAPAPNVKSEIRKDLVWKGPFGGKSISAQPSTPQMLAKPAPTMPGILPASPGTTIPGLGAKSPAPAAPVKTMAERVAAKVPASDPAALTPAQASAPPLFSKPTAPPPPSATPGLFGGKK